jgi:hypothetical protein
MEMKPRSDIMELAQKIEAAFISQVREEELRAKRTLRVLQHQQEQIRRLQRLQQVQQNINSPFGITSQEDIANESNDDPNLGDLVQHSHKDEMRRRNPTEHGDQAYYNKEGSVVQILFDNSIHQTWPKASELQNIQREMQYTKDVLLRSKGKIETLEKAVCVIQGSRSDSEANLLAEEMSGWRSTIDNALLTIETTAMDKRIWKTALEFFTPQEALHFLTAEKIGTGTFASKSQSV